VISENTQRADIEKRPVAASSAAWGRPLELAVPSPIRLRWIEADTQQAPICQFGLFFALNIGKDEPFLLKCSIPKVPN